MTPMIDVVFLLIIFFMTCSQAAVPSETEAVDLPPLPGTADRADRDLTVTVTEDDRVFIDGIAVTAAEVETRAKAVVVKVGKLEAVTVGLRVDRKAKSGAVNQVVAALKRAGVPRGRIAVEPGQ